MLGHFFYVNVLSVGVQRPDLSIFNDHAELTLTPPNHIIVAELQCSERSKSINSKQSFIKKLLVLSLLFCNPISITETVQVRVALANG